MDSRGYKTAAKARDNGSGADVYDDYAPVFQEIMPDAGSSVDDKLDAAISRIVAETVGDIPEGKVSSGRSAGTKKHTGLKIFGIILALLLVGLATTYCVFAYQYRQKFIEGTYINGIDASEKTAAEVEAEIKQTVEKYSVTLTFRDGKSESLSNSDIGYTYVSNNGVQKIMDEQNTFLWISGKMGQKKEYTVSEATTFDQDKLKAALSALPEMNADKSEAPTNAYLNLQADNTFNIVAEEQGNTLNADVVLAALADTVKNSKPSLDVSSLKGAYETPTVLATNKDLVAQMNILNNFLATQITYELPQGNQTLDRSTLIKWITKQDNGFYYIDQANLQTQVTAYVKAMAAATDYQKDTRDFYSTNRGTISFSCASYGVIIDQATEVTNTLNDLNNCTSGTREPAWSQHDSAKDPTFGGTYVEVDKVNQHMYYYKDGVLKLDSDCVTGTADGEHDTPTGIYSVYDMERDRTLHGNLLPDGSYAYTSEVKYWMPFHEGCGLHDAPWRGEFGGDIYKTSGSHGCVNLPTDVAATLYSYVYVGIPVIVF